jgi:hypothetical protein
MLGNSDVKNYAKPLGSIRSRPVDPCFINPRRSPPLLGDEQLPVMSACPLVALPNARLPSATHLIAQLEPAATVQQWQRHLRNLYVCAWEPPGHEWRLNRLAANSCDGHHIYAVSAGTAELSVEAG